MSKSPPIETSVGDLRRLRGLTAISLAATAGVTRQTIYAIEAGTYVPNTAVALRLARALDSTVEELFALTDTSKSPAPRSAGATLLPGDHAWGEGQPVQLCRVNKKLLASPASALPWYFPAVDGVVHGRVIARRQTSVRLFRDESEIENRILVAGCDPGLSVLSRHVRTAGIELVLAHRNSSQALSLLKSGCVHVAGTHLKDDASGESNLLEIGKLFPKKSVAVVSLAVWEQGIAIPKGNPKGITGIADFGRKDVEIVNREKGAGNRALLDAGLKGAGIAHRSVQGYGRFAAGHLAAASQVLSGTADCCLATRAAARMFGLSFIPLTSERYDLVINRHHLALPRIQNLLDVLSRGSYRRELDGLGGYDMRLAGNRIL